ncbi:hypothetical protein [Vitreoscilla stercoraria]|uniref:Mor transcription activator domain-containing protein n=1 Tax=Vitreoscilla stercoraria TaxID=61 RepID=A0ABY4EEB5_VITST|nr:hypothetical protein [Vitreoscilla stercoraria]UOO93559.1 hypothetical protein LVJ81_05920 [Vitreoscilla stercoraria]
MSQNAHLPITEYQAVYETIKHVLPDSFHKITALIGLDAAFKLAERYQGCVIQVTKSKTKERQAIEALIGAEKVTLLFEPYYKQRKISFPSLKNGALYLRDLQMVKRYKELTNKDMPMTNMAAIDILSTEYRLNVQRVRKILLKHHAL